MTIEEKANAYDKTLELLKGLIEGTREDKCAIVEEDIISIFPELKKSENEWIEKIRKDLISYLNNRQIFSFAESNAAERWIAWIEKQGKQKFTDKVEPKFKVGDWVIYYEYHNSVYQVERIDNYRYYLRHYLGDTLSVHFDSELIRQWTITDAKDGDVLAGSKKEVILMFRRIGNAEWDDVIDYHCYYDCYHKDFIVQKDVEYWGNTENNQLVPATKEQRDLLFKKMHEAGYVWDVEKKELKRMVVVPIFNIGDTIVKKHNSDIHDFGSFTITNITDGKYWYNDRIICDITKQDEWEIYEIL